MSADEDAIVDAAYTLFRQRGIRGTTMRQVARACDVSRRDINQAFKSKKELVLAVIRHVVTKKAVHLSISSSLAPSAVAELNTFFSFVDETLAAPGAEILGELKGYHPLALDQLRDVVDDRLVPYLKKNIQRGISEGFYRKELDAELLASSYFYLLRTLLESGDVWSQTRNTVAYINDIFLHGVLNSKGMRV